MEKLEKYIIENREDFDCAVPSLKVWAEIDKELEKKPYRRVRMWRGLRVAAAVALLLISGVAGGAYFSDHFGENEGAIAQLAPEHSDLEGYYIRQVAQKTKQLVSLQDEGMSNVQEDLNRLDDTFVELMEEYKKLPSGSGEIVIKAMLENYQMKLDVLERVLEKINGNNSENEFSPNQIKKEDETGLSI